VSAEALRLRAKAERWAKRSDGSANSKLGKKKSKLGKLEEGKPCKPRQTPVNPGKCVTPHAGETAAPQEPDGPDLDVTKLPLRWQVLIEEYLIDFNGTQAAIRSGYSPGNASTQAAEVLQRPEVRAIVQARTEDRLEAIRMSRERVLDEFASLAEADANELSEHRRVCCRHCWGTVDEDTGAQAFQMTPAEFVKGRKEWAEKSKKAMEKDQTDIGPYPHEPGNWYDKRKAINPDCGECFGDGVGEVLLKDTRNISRRARAIYGGVKEGKDGIEIKTYSKEGALGVLAKHHKIYDEAPVVSLTTTTSEELDAIYARGVADADAAKARVVGRGDRVRAGVRGAHGS
jgi:phage terminase small subunit